MTFFFLFVRLICGEIQEKCQRFTALCRTGEECSEARRPRFEPVSVSCQDKFLGLGGVVWASLAFSLLRDFVYTAKGPCKVSSARGSYTQAFIVKDRERHVSKLIAADANAPDSGLIRRLKLFILKLKPAGSFNSVSFGFVSFRRDFLSKMF